MEVVITFNLQTIEIKSRRHTAHAIIGLKDYWLMAIFGQLVSHRQAHWASAQYCNSLFQDQNSITTLL
jgi:hypothetical protein